MADEHYHNNKSDERQAIFAMIREVKRRVRAESKRVWAQLPVKGREWCEAELATFKAELDKNGGEHA